MRIALIVPWLEVGGVESFVFRLGSFLQAEKHQVEIIVTESAGAWFDRAKELGLPVVFLPVQDTWSEAGHARKVARYLNEGRFDICLLNHARFAQATLALLSDRIAVIPVLHNDHEQIYEVGSANAHAWNVAVAVSQRVFHQLTVRVPGKPVEQISYGVEIPPLRQLDRRHFKSSELRLLFVGRLDDRQKGVFLLPRILADCRRRGLTVTLTMVGDGPDKDQLLAQACTLHVRDLIECKGALAKEAVFEELLQAHVLLMPSNYEGLPIVMLEAMACGCVPVVSKLDGITDFVLGDGHSGLQVEIGNATKFGEALSLLAKDRDQLKRLSCAARQTAEQRFSVELMCRTYLQLMVRAQDGIFPLPQSRSKLPRLDRTLFGRRHYLPKPAYSAYQVMARIVGK